MATSFGYTSNSEQYRNLERQIKEQQREKGKPQIEKTKETRVYDKVLDIFLDRYNKLAKRGCFPYNAEFRKVKR